MAMPTYPLGFDKDIFTGSPSLKKLVDTYQPKLSAEEQSFMDNQVQTLCTLLNDHDVSINRDFSKEAWDYMRSEKFFGMKIPKEWGGLGFSTHAVSSVLQKLATQCFDANATVAVPNSLGPGELARPIRYAGAEGVLPPPLGRWYSHPVLWSHWSSFRFRCHQPHWIRLYRHRAQWRARCRCHFQEAPVAGVVGLGLNLRDPNGLLKGQGDEGFTVALLERDHEGLRMGPRHMPLNAAFMNGTVEGEEVWIPMSSILGGQERCGFGWNMFVECLAEGRGVSLPAGSVGAARTVTCGVGAYSRVRKQFRVPIAEFGGIQEGTFQVCIIIGFWRLQYLFITLHVLIFY